MSDQQPDHWMQRARSNLLLAKQQCDGVMLEDLCFQAQQALEPRSPDD
jgi:hypothetical protein